MTTKYDARYWTAAEVLAGVVERPASERRDAGGVVRPRFTVLSDGQAFFANTTRQLEQLLSCTRAARPLVFINRDKGVTVDFDGGAA
jgi:hypothetical protein